MLPDISLKAVFGRVFKYGVLSAVFGPLVLGVAQCSSENNYDPWDGEAVDSYIENVSDSYYWEMKQVRKGLEFIGDRLPEFKP